MINPFKDVNWHPDPKERRAFARSLMLGFPCLAAAWLFLSRLSFGYWDARVPLFLAGGGLLVGMLLWLLPSISKPVYVAWYFAACSLGLVIGNLSLAIVYYVLITGLGWGMRLFRRNPIRRKRDPAVITYWLDVEKVQDPARYYRQF